MPFQNRQEAGNLLAQKLKSLKFHKPLILALPRGGVPIAAKVAEMLHVPMEVLVVRKIGAPDNPEYGIGAITEDGLYLLNDEAVEELGIEPGQLQPILDRELNEVKRRIQQFRGNRAPPPVHGRNVILVDDGLATGVTASVAAEYLKQRGAKSVTFAAPVCARDSARHLRNEVDQVICLEEPERFFAVGLWYEDFTQLSDDDVISFLNQSGRPHLPPQPLNRLSEFESLGISKEIMIQDNSTHLGGQLNLPSVCKGIVIFAHGSGSSRFSPRNQQVARTLNEAGIATLLFDLLDPIESENRSNVFDIPFLANRLLLATEFIKNERLTQNLPVGYFGASTGAGAALWAAAELGHEICAVVSRGGRPDLAIPRLAEVTAPVLLIVGGDDEPVIEMNEEALESLNQGKLVIVPNATHLFEEPGALETVAKHAIDWFSHHFEELSEKRRNRKTA